MFCSKCGGSVADGSAFCPNCGAPMQTAAPQQVYSSPGTEPQKTGAAAFFTSPGGIAFTILMSILVIAGIVIGIIFAVRAGSGSGFEDELSKVWDEYNDITDEADQELATIDLTSAKLEADLEKYQRELENTQKRVDALEDVLRSLKPPNTRWKTKYDQLAGSIKYYNRYTVKLNELYVALATGNLADQVNTLQATLTNLQELASEAKDLADDFLKDNDVVTGGDFDPEIFNIPTDVANQATAIIGGEITTDEGTTGRDTTADITQARAVMEEVLSLYRGGGWQAITGHMTPELYQAYINAPVPWDQVSYVITSTTITSETMTDPNTVVFRVEQVEDDFGEIFTEYIDWQMVRSGATWRVNNATDQYGGSKL